MHESNRTCTAKDDDETIHTYRTANGIPGQQDMTRFYMKRYRHEEKEEEDILAFYFSFVLTKTITYYVCLSDFPYVFVGTDI